MHETKARVLVVEDEPMKLYLLKEQLEANGFVVAVAGNPLEAQPLLAEPFDVVITDLRMPGRDGLTFLRDLKRLKPDQAVIVMTAYATVETAIEAMKLGASDYLQKPFLAEEMVLKVNRLLQQERLANENAALRRRLSELESDSRIIGTSEAIRSVLARINAVNDTDCSVLIEGESGTGKGLVARVLHETLYRRAGPFVAVTCAALPRDLIETELFGHEAGAFTGAARRRIGRFELARGGTLFLDEVDDIPQQVQVKLLRVLQERVFERVGGEQTLEADVRLIAAAKKPLESLVAAGQFREDLFYRLNTVRLRIPPLRERPEDIPVLAEHFLARFALRFNRDRMTLSPEAMAALARCPWPGNVRELQHFLEAMAVLNRKSHFDLPDLHFRRAAEPAGPVTLSLGQAQSIDLPAVVEELEDRLVQWAMERSAGNLARAAEMLSIPRSTMQYKVAKVSTKSKAGS